MYMRTSILEYLLFVIFFVSTYGFLKTHNPHVMSQRLYGKEVLNTEMFNDKKVLTISPGGVRGFYFFGICKFLKDNYDLDNFLYCGASAGAWNSLFMTYKKDPKDFTDALFEINYDKIKSLGKLQTVMKDKLLSKFDSNDFDLNKLYLSVSNVNKFSFKKNIYTNFDDLDDAVDCCIASSHIPLITGGLLKRYNGKITFDGGFNQNPYLDTESFLHIDENFCLGPECTIYPNTIDIGSFDQKNVNFYDLFCKGYKYCEKNKIYLDEIFINKNNPKLFF